MISVLFILSMENHSCECCYNAKVDTCQGHLIGLLVAPWIPLSLNCQIRYVYSKRLALYRCMSCRYQGHISTCFTDFLKESYGEVLLRKIFWILKHNHYMGFSCEVDGCCSLLTIW